MYGYRGVGDPQCLWIFCMTDSVLALDTELEGGRVSDVARGGGVSGVARGGRVSGVARGDGISGVARGGGVSDIAGGKAE